MKRKTSHTSDDGLKSTEDVVSYLMANVYKQNKIEFYQNLPTRALENLIASLFESKHMTHQEKMFVLGLIKKHPFILNLAYSREKFDHLRPFRFLQKGVTIQRDKLRALEEIMLPFCKQFPQKVLTMLSKNVQVKKIILEGLYLKPLFKIFYTTVFCIHTPYDEDIGSIIKQGIEAIAHSLLDFLPTNSQGLKLFDFTQVACNFNDFLSDLIINLNTVDLPLLIILFELMDEEYLETLFKLFQEYAAANFQYLQYSQFLVQILLTVLKIFESIKINLDRRHIEDEKKELQNLQKLLLDISKWTAKKMPQFTHFLLEEGKIKINYSSGQVFWIVGMVKYKVLQLIEKVLSLNELQDLQIDFSRFDFFPVIEYYIEKHKWNNIIHNLILKIAELIISQDYRHFKERYINQKEDYVQKFFGSLISNFRNRQFCFLHSLRMTNNGNQCPIYELSKMLVNEMKENDDLGTLIQHFKIWKQFMESDLKKFQALNFVEQQVPERDRSPSPDIRRSRHRSYDFTRTPMDVKQTSNIRSLQTFEQIMAKLKEQDKWSPKLPSKESNTKQKIQDSLVRFDSMGLLDQQVEQ